MSNDIIVDVSQQNISQNSIPSEDDHTRKELPWETRGEKILLNWYEDCKKRSKAHDLKGKRYKNHYAVFGIPSILIPIILGGVSSIVPCNSIIYSLGMMTSGLFSGTNLFFNFGKQTACHQQFSAKYFELSTEIESELSKPKRFRVACDVYIERIKNKYNSLCTQAPNL